ncbi:MAG TPA: universal stress protein [Terriglobia bacterium]|nr:universal stress protein [Terriglobia bacterium]
MVEFEKILCPVDFFPASMHAFDYAVKLARNYDARIHALHVVAPVIPAAYGAPLNVGELTADLEKESKRVLARLKAKGEKAGVPIDTEVRIGDIDVEIHRAIDKRNASLVVMGSHGRRGFERWVMGSVTERMLRRCPVPLIVIGHGSERRSIPPKINRILVTTDFSDGTGDALSYAFSIAQECQARMTLLHVVEELSAEIGSELTQPLVASVRKKLEALIPEDVRDWCEVKTRVEVGDPHTVISEIVETQKPGLLVMNIHGKGMIERALLGRTAERVLRSVVDICPVFLIPPARAQKKRKASA